MIIGGIETSQNIIWFWNLNLFWYETNADFHFEQLNLGNLKVVFDVKLDGILLEKELLI